MSLKKRLLLKELFNNPIYAPNINNTNLEKKKSKNDNYVVVNKQHINQKRKSEYWIERVHRPSNINQFEKDGSLSNTEQRLIMNRTPQRKYFGRTINKLSRDDPILICKNNLSMEKEHKNKHQRNIKEYYSKIGEIKDKKNSFNPNLPYSNQNDSPKAGYKCDNKSKFYVFNFEACKASNNVPVISEEEYQKPEERYTNLQSENKLRSAEPSHTSNYLASKRQTLKNENNEGNKQSISEEINKSKVMIKSTTGFNMLFSDETKTQKKQEAQKHENFILRGVNDFANADLLEQIDHVGHNNITDNLRNKLKDKISIIVRTPTTNEFFNSNTKDNL